MKTALVIRYGGYGDMIMATPLFRALKDGGYHVTLNGIERTINVVDYNPCIDEYMRQEDGAVPPDALPDYWEEISCGYDKVVNLSGSIEGKLLKQEGTEEFNWSHDRRHEDCNHNYYDWTLEVGGYPHIKGKRGELYFSPWEERWARDYRRKYKNKFLIVWVLTGSSFHKAYPYAEYVMRAFLDKYPDVMIATVGEAACMMLEWSHPRLKQYSGNQPFRRSMVLAKHADLVVGTETGLMVAAGCFDVPKVIMLSHASEENLTKYWTNTQVIHPDCECHPCHRLIYTLEACPWDMELFWAAGVRTPKCVGKTDPGQVFLAMENVYFSRKEMAVSA